MPACHPTTLAADIGALMRKSRAQLLVPSGGGVPAAGARRQLPPGSRLDAIAAADNPIYSPDDSLAKAASKLAGLKALRSSVAPPPRGGLPQAARADAAPHPQPQPCESPQLIPAEGSQGRLRYALAGRAAERPLLLNTTGPPSLSPLHRPPAPMCPAPPRLPLCAAARTRVSWRRGRRCRRGARAWRPRLPPSSGMGSGLMAATQTWSTPCMCAPHARALLLMGKAVQLAARVGMLAAWGAAVLAGRRWAQHRLTAAVPLPAIPRNTTGQGLATRKPARA